MVWASSYRMASEFEQASDSQWSSAPARWLNHAEVLTCCSSSFVDCGSTLHKSTYSMSFRWGVLRLVGRVTIKHGQLLNSLQRKRTFGSILFFLTLKSQKRLRTRAKQLDNWWIVSPTINHEIVLAMITLDRLYASICTALTGLDSVLRPSWLRRGVIRPPSRSAPVSRGRSSSKIIGKILRPCQVRVQRDFCKKNEFWVS